MIVRTAAANRPPPRNMHTGSVSTQASRMLRSVSLCKPERCAAIGLAVKAAGERVPWVLDPVLVDRSAPRAAYAKTLVADHPRAIRLNGAEFRALVAAEPSAAALARYGAQHASIIGLTGDRDIVASMSDAVSKLADSIALAAASLPRQL